MRTSVVFTVLIVFFRHVALFDPFTGTDNARPGAE